jgi:drug/metabolite transporter (DMT)-like permease
MIGDPATNSARTTAAGIAFGFLAALIWGAWPVASRLGLMRALDPFDIAALRFGVAGLLLAPIVVRRGVGALGWRRALVLACGAGVPYVLLATVGLTVAPASHAGVITPSAMLVAATVGGALCLRERVDAQRAIGVAVAIAGVSAIALGSRSLGRDGVALADLLFVAAGFLWALYTLGVRAWSVDASHAAALVAVMSAVAYLPLYALLDHSSLHAASLREIVLQGAFQGVVAAIGGLVCYTRAVALLGASRAALFAAIAPGVAVIVAIPALGERPTSAEWLGVALAFSAMALSVGAGAGSRTTSAIALGRRLDAMAAGLLAREGHAIELPSMDASSAATTAPRSDERGRFREPARYETEPVGA